MSLHDASSFLGQLCLEMGCSCSAGSFAFFSVLIIASWCQIMGIMGKKTRKCECHVVGHAMEARVWPSIWQC